MESKQYLAVFAIFALAFALFNLVVTMNKVGDIKTITGYAEAGDTGEVNVTIATNIVLNFVTTFDALNWGSGHVDAAATAAVFDTDLGTVVDGIGWGSVSNGLLLQNEGNVDVDVYLKSSKEAGVFICPGSPNDCTVVGGGSDDAELQWQLNENILGSCTGQVGGEWIGWVDVCDPIANSFCDDSPLSADEGRSICTDFNQGALAVNSGTNEIEIDFRLVVPRSAGVGEKTVTITASGYAI